MTVPSLDVALTYNLRTDEDDESQAERLDQDYVDGVADALRGLGHRVTMLEVSGPAPKVFRRLADVEPQIVFNLAEGEEGVWREAFYPMLFDFLGYPYTGAGPGVLGMGLDKRLTEEALALRGVDVPRGRLVTPDEPDIPDDLRYPLLIKPNFEGSSMGIHQDSIVHGPDEAKELVDDMLEEFPEGLDVEEYIEGRELTVGYLARADEPFTEIVEYRFPEDRENIMDYETKQAEGEDIETLCPPPLDDDTRDAVYDIAARAVSAMRTPDFARIDLRMRGDGKLFLIELNPLPGLREVSPLVVGAKAQGLDYEEIIDAVITSAALRYELIEEMVARS